MSMLCKKLKLYAPVNFAVAVEPFIALMETMPWLTVVAVNTFTQGRLKYRYRIDIKSGVVDFTPNNTGDGPPAAKNTLCSIPVSNVNPVLRFNMNYSSTRASRRGAMR
jgi:hypothetical protein